jgi:hypothetical protein
LFAVSTSADLLAATIGAELETYSCAEFISQDRVTFPHTLYKGIQQVDPRIFLTANSSGFKAVQANGDIPATRDSNQLPSKVLSRITEEFWSRVKKNKLRPRDFRASLSAGLDSRFVLASAIEHFGKISSFTYSPQENEEVRTARKVAQALKAKHSSHLWNRDTYSNRFLLGQGLVVGSHLSWLDAHFLDAQKPFNKKPVVGGYLSDALLAQGSGSYMAHKKLLEDKGNEAIPNWATYKSWLALPPSFKEVLSLRQRELEVCLPDWIREHKDLRFTWPLSRAQAASHWISLSGQSAQYELFFIRSVAELITSIGSNRAAAGIKAQVLNSTNLELHSEIPTNPRSPIDVEHGSWLSFVKELSRSDTFREGAAKLNQQGQSKFSELTEIPFDEVGELSTKHGAIQIEWASRCVQHGKNQAPWVHELGSDAQSSK